MSKDSYNPVPVDVAATHKRWMEHKGFKAAYDVLEDEYAALGALLRARQLAGLTQAQVAERMGIAQASVARLESSAGNRKHAPSLATLRRYADAVDCDLHLSLTPKSNPVGNNASGSEPPRTEQRVKRGTPSLLECRLAQDAE